MTDRTLAVRRLSGSPAMTSVALVLITMAMLAALLPARRASRLDPINALRTG